MNMISDMSRIDLDCTKTVRRRGRMIFSVQDDFMISGMLADDKRCMAVEYQHRRRWLSVDV